MPVFIATGMRGWPGSERGGSAGVDLEWSGPGFARTWTVQGVSQIVQDEDVHFCVRLGPVLCGYASNSNVCSK